MNINTEIQEAIKKNLPSAVGDELKIRLNQADEFEVKIKELESSLKKYEAREEKSSKEISEYRALIGKHVDIDEKIIELSKRENAIHIKELELKLNAESRLNQVLQTTLQGLVRNTEYRSNIFDNNTVSKYNHQTFQNENTTTTHSVEEKKTAD